MHGRPSPKELLTSSLTVLSAAAMTTRRVSAAGLGEVSRRAARVVPFGTRGTCSAAPASCFRRVDWDDLHEYTLGDVLGSGAFATVRRCRRGGETFAMKVVSKLGAAAERDEKEGTNATDALHELRVLYSIGSHPQIIRLADSFETSDAFVFVLENAEGGELFARICECGAYSEADAARATRQIGAALQHLGAIGVAHRDLKPENLLLKSARPDADGRLWAGGLLRWREPTDGRRGGHRLLLRARGAAG